MARAVSPFAETSLSLLTSVWWLRSCMQRPGTPEPALDVHHFRVLGAEACAQDFVRALGQRIAAGEEVDGGVATLGPGVDREMRLFDDDHAGNPCGSKG